MHGAVVVVLLTFLGAPAGPKPLVIVPFGPNGTDANAVSDALGLELVLDEDLLISPHERVLDNLGTDVREALPDDVMGALLQEEMAAMLRAEPIADDPSSMALLLHRARDGRVVWGTVVVTKVAMESPMDLANEVSAAMRELDALPALSPAALTALTTPPPPPPPVEKQPSKFDTAPVANDPNTTTTSDGSSTTSDASTTTRREWPFDRILRFSVFASPTYLQYEACQPEGAALPFQCTPPDDVKPTRTTIYPLGAPASLGLNLDATPWVPFIGLHVDASAYMARPSIVGGEDLYDGGRTDFQVYGGTFAGALSLTGAVAFGAVGIEGGARAGYVLLFAVAEPHYIESEPRDYLVVLLPPFFTHAISAGLTASVSYARWVRFVVDADVLPLVLQVERDTTVSADPFLFGAGARAKAQLDVDIAFGIFASLLVEGTVMSARGNGEGTRDTRALTPFKDGVVSLTTARSGIGLGWHF